MLGHQFAYSAAPIRKVKEVQFGILSPEEIVRFFCGFFVNFPGSPLYDRKHTPLQRLSILKLWMRQLINPRSED